MAPWPMSRSVDVCIVLCMCESQIWHSWRWSLLDRNQENHVLYTWYDKNKSWHLITPRISWSCSIEGGFNIRTPPNSPKPPSYRFPDFASKKVDSSILPTFFFGCFSLSPTCSGTQSGGTHLCRQYVRPMQGNPHPLKQPHKVQYLHFGWILWWLCGQTLLGTVCRPTRLALSPSFGRCRVPVAPWREGNS